MVLDKTWTSTLASSVEVDYTDLVAEVKTAVEAVTFDIGDSEFTSVDVTGFTQVTSDARRKRRETGDVEASVDIYFTATTQVKESEAEAAKEDDATFEETVTGLEEAVLESLTAGDVDILAQDVTEVESDIILEDEEEEDYEVSATVAAEYEQTKEYPEDPTATCEDPVEIDLNDDSIEEVVGCDAAEEVDAGAEAAGDAINDAIADSDIADGTALVGSVATLVDKFEPGITTTSTTSTTTSTTTTTTTSTTSTTTSTTSTSTETLSTSSVMSTSTLKLESPTTVNDQFTPSAQDTTIESTSVSTSTIQLDIESTVLDQNTPGTEGKFVTWNIGNPIITEQYWI